MPALERIRNFERFPFGVCRFRTIKIKQPPKLIIDYRRTGERISLRIVIDDHFPDPIIIELFYHISSGVNGGHRRSANTCLGR